MPYETIDIDHRPGLEPDQIAVVTMRRPEKLNAMTGQLVQDLHDALEEVGDDPGVRVVILTGAGRGFCAGLDLRGYGDIPTTKRRTGKAGAGMRVQQHIAALVTRLRGLRQPVIAAVNGPAAGGGFALALASDVRIAAASAKFNAAFVRIGLSACDIGVSWMLPRLIGASKAFELLLTGRVIDAAEADRIGLVLKVVDDTTLLDAAMETAELICRNSPMGVWMTKEVMWSQLEIPSLQAGIDMENRNQMFTSATSDHQEALRAFLEKRPPKFTFS